MEATKIIKLSEDKAELQNENQRKQIKLFEQSEKIVQLENQLDQLEKINQELDEHNKELEAQLLYLPATQKELERMYGVLADKEKENKRLIQREKEKNKEIEQGKAKAKQEKIAKDNAVKNISKYRKEARESGKTIASFAKTIDSLSLALAATTSMIHDLSESYDTRCEADEKNLKTMCKTVAEVKGMKYSGGKTIGKLINELKEQGAL